MMYFIGHEYDSSHLVKVTLLHSIDAKIILNRSTLGYEIYFQCIYLQKKDDVRRAVVVMQVGVPAKILTLYQKESMRRRQRVPFTNEAQIH